MKIYCHYVKRITLNYIMATTDSHNIPKELYHILKRATNLEIKTNKPLMMIPVSKNEYYAFKSFLKTIQPCFDK